MAAPHLNGSFFWKTVFRRQDFSLIFHLEQKTKKFLVLYSIFLGKYTWKLKILLFVRTVRDEQNVSTIFQNDTFGSIKHHSYKKQYFLISTCTSRDNLIYVELKKFWFFVLGQKLKENSFRRGTLFFRRSFICWAVAPPYYITKNFKKIVIIP